MISFVADSYIYRFQDTHPPISSFYFFYFFLFSLAECIIPFCVSVYIRLTVTTYKMFNQLLKTSRFWICECRCCLRFAILLALLLFSSFTIFSDSALYSTVHNESAYSAYIPFILKSYTRTVGVCMQYFVIIFRCHYCMSRFRWCPIFCFNLTQNHWNKLSLTSSFIQRTLLSR